MTKKKREKNSEKGEKNSDKCRSNFRKCEKIIMNMALLVKCRSARVCPERLKRKYSTRTKDPSNTVTCAYCNEKFKNKNSLKSHVSKAKGTKCSRDHATSGLSANLEERQKIAAKEFVCNTCGKRYISQDSMDRHVRGVHKKIKQ